MTLPVPGKVPIRVLVVDDSAFMRYTITKHLNETPGIVVVGTGHDGQEALDLIPKLLPDVVTLDVEMPHMDGLSTLRQIMTRFPRPVIMLSSLTKEGAIETVQALTLGAVDFIAKPTNKANVTSVMEEVAKKIFRASQARVWVYKPIDTISPKTSNQKQSRMMSKQEKLVIIGTSTGGPRALNTVVPMLTADLPAAVLIIQHMPVGFTRSLAERLDATSALKVKEAEPGDGMEVGRALLAPGGFHMLLDESQKIILNQNPPVHGVRPAVDVTLISAVKYYGSRIVTAILTGMGNDGTNGSALIHNSGGWVIAEAEETSVVWGMPRSVYEAGAADEVVPLQEVASAITRAVKR
jgi:two-component system, chemotaxis family, protein-glutamate methylesterase/glutaminase